MEKSWEARLMKRKLLVTVIAIIVVIVVSGFVVGMTFYPANRVVGEYDVMKPSITYPQESVPAAAPSKGGVEDTTGTTEWLDLVDRKIVYNAWLSLEVEDVDAAVEQIQAIAEEFGGYVSHISVSKDEEVGTGSITLRIPQADFYTVISRVEQLGEIEDKNIGSEDVTERYIDLEARLENAEAEEERLLQIMEQAEEVKDMLEVERELNRIREQIEVYTGQLKYLESRVDYSTISVSLSEPSPPAPLPEVDWDATVKAGLWGLLVIVQGLIVLVFVIIPPIVVGVPLYYLYRRYRKKTGVQGAN